jgi:hypothetical protein
MYFLSFFVYQNNPVILFTLYFFLSDHLQNSTSVQAYCGSNLLSNIWTLWRIWHSDRSLIRTPTPEAICGGSIETPTGRRYSSSSVKTPAACLTQLLLDPSPPAPTES